jgi:endonuclease/exonuclease/phosphatase (EEP) superfamily protein YafD
MDSFAPPNAPGGPNPDFVDARPPVLATVAGVALLGSGLAWFAAGVQVLLLITVANPLWYAPAVVMAGCGLVIMPAGALATRARAIALGAALVASAAALLAGGVWVLYMLWNGAFSFLAFMASLLGVLAVGLGAFALPGVLAVDRARRALWAA